MLLAFIICIRNTFSSKPHLRLLSAIQIESFDTHLRLYTMKITSIYPIALRLSLLVACEVAATDERRLKSFGSSLEIVPNFLKHQAIGPSVSIVEKAIIRGGKLRGKARVSRSLINSVNDVFHLPGMNAMEYDEATLFNTQVIDATTDKHVDSYLVPDGERHLVENDKRVAFVFLNTNQDAHFVHDDVSVPVVEGTLVHFNGAIPHQTIVNSGVVQLLGPIYSNDFTATVGNDDVVGTSSPTELPTKAKTTKTPKATKAPAKAKAGKQGKGVTSSVPDDNSTGDSNGEIEIPLDASMPTSLSVPAGEDLSGEIDTSIEIPLDASMPTSLSVPAGDIPGDSFGKIDEIPFDASLSMSF